MLRESIFFWHGLHGLHGTHPLPNETSGRLDDTETSDKSASSNQPKATETPGNEIRVIREIRA